MNLKFDWKDENYQNNYEILLEALEKDKRPWKPVSLLEKEDGKLLFFKCGKNWEDEDQFDIGYWEDYKKRQLWTFDDLEGEWNTEFGNCEEIVGWREAEKLSTSSS